jgi:hypothetical protein
VLPFNHAPYELLPFLPLATLSFQSAHIVWSLISILFLLLACAILISLTTPKHKVLFSALVLSFYPSVMAIKMGQDSAMSLLIMVAVFASLKYRRDVAAGAILALGLYKPQLSLPLAGFLLVSGNWRAIRGFATMGVCLLGISVVMVGWQGVAGLVSIVLSMDRPTTIVYPAHMANLRGLFFPLLSLLGSPELTNVFTGVTSLIVYGYSLMLWKRGASADGLIFDLHFSLVVVATVLISYHLYPHDVIILVIPLILTLNYVIRDQAAVTSAHKVFLFVVVLLYLPLIPIILELTAAFGALVGPVILLYGYLAVEVASLKLVTLQPTLVNS